MDKLLWCDIETTGLDPTKGEVLEIGLAVTDKSLNILGRINVVIEHDLKDIKPLCSPYVIDMHTNNKLFEEIESRSTTLEQRDAELLLIDFVREYFPDPKNKPPLHGNTVHFDKKWLGYHFPKLEEMFNYRIVDVSSFKLIMSLYDNEWYASLPTPTAIPHRSMEDIEGSIEEFRTYLSKLNRL